MWQLAVISLILVSSVRGVSIAKDSSGSIAVQRGQEILIDCDFSFEKEEEEELVVKWFFNGSTTPFYQWVPALDVGPQVITREAPGEIDISYSVEEGNSFTKHRTLRIAEASLAHIGAYTCQISSFRHEVSSTVEVAVYVPPSSMVLTSTSSGTDNLVTLTCIATEAFPAPILSLAWTEGLASRNGETLSKSSENSEGLITSSVSTTIGRDLVAKEDMAVCSLEMPGFDVHMKEEVPVLEDEIPEIYLKMFENGKQSEEKDNVMMAWQEEKEVGESALQKQQTQMVETGESGEDEESSGYRSFISSSLFGVPLIYLIFC